MLLPKLEENALSACWDDAFCPCAVFITGSMWKLSLGVWTDSHYNLSTFSTEEVHISCPKRFIATCLAHRAESLQIQKKKKELLTDFGKWKKYKMYRGRKMSTDTLMKCTWLASFSHADTHICQQLDVLKPHPLLLSITRNKQKNVENTRRGLDKSAAILFRLSSVFYSLRAFNLALTCQVMLVPWQQIKRSRSLLQSNLLKWKRKNYVGTFLNMGGSRRESRQWWEEQNDAHCCWK